MESTPFVGIYNDITDIKETYDVSPGEITAKLEVTSRKDGFEFHCEYTMADLDVSQEEIYPLNQESTASDDPCKEILTIIETLGNETEATVSADVRCGGDQFYYDGTGWTNIT